MRKISTKFHLPEYAAGLLTSLFLNTGFAQTTPAPSEQAPLARVEVAGRADVDERPYERFVKAMDFFDAESPKLAPQSKLRFRLVTKHRSARVDELKLAVTGPTVHIPLELMPQNFFTIERNARALHEDATVRSNRKNGTFDWSVDVRTPGLPRNTRRLGDLRLQCRIELLAAKLGQHVFSPLYFVQTAAGADPCALRNTSMLLIGDEPIFAVTLVQGARRQVLPAASLYGGSLPSWTKAITGDWLGRDHLFEVPLWDASWPDDTLVELEPMRTVQANATEAEPPPASELLQSVTRESLARWVIEGRTSGKDVEGVFGHPEVIQFSHGDASWVFRTETGSGKIISAVPVLGILLKPERKLKELHLIIGPGGIVKQYQLEEMVLRF
ncbi:hypothetical protein GTP23_07000 [Pseudoduganella sp. FT93W]|uniref:Uncharacterized protein n=1 Tax=Duganella fentianensis TaxID=2692177 RepID=A0A845HZB4_9BURK|nr:hypothetical protein [Duganella fentianensis]MYN44821.1 hypothetical protein [Duganella fentianensis]